MNEQSKTTNTPIDGYLAVMPSCLRLPLITKWFEMTKAGIKREDYREINDYWIKRLVDTVTFFGGKFESMKNISIKEAGISNVNLLHVTLETIKNDVVFKKFENNIMTLGYPKSSDTEKQLKYKHAGIEIRTGNPEWGAIPNKRYFVIMHGDVIA